MLPKWPGLLVNGKPITTKQAEEVLIRTQDIARDYLYSNNREFKKALSILLKEKGYSDDTSEASYEYRQMHDVLDIRYLWNEQICSNYIGGPYGWCHWNGTIWANTYNIGKWPSVPEVTAEWKTIAKAFPFLDLQCQLLNQEICEGESKPFPLIQFNIKDGEVEVIEDNLTLIIEPYDNTKQLISNFLSRDSDIGCSINKLKTLIKENTIK